MALTNKVIFINDVKQEDEKPVEFTEYLSMNKGWIIATSAPNDPCIESVTYLGKELGGIDLFLTNEKDGLIGIYKGHLNSGKY